MNCTQVVETMPAVTTIRITTAPTSTTPAQCGKPEQRLHEHARADHLRDQIEDAHDQRADAGGELDAAAS